MNIGDLKAYKTFIKSFLDRILVEVWVCVLERSETHLRGFGGKRRGGELFTI